MRRSRTEKQPSISTSALKWIVSSSLFLTALAIWATLLGLMYRVGWLSTFAIDSQLFLPESATELTYWGYLAAVDIWGVSQRELTNATWTSFKFGAGYAALALLTFAALHLAHRNKESVQQGLEKLRKGYWRYAAGSALSIWIGVTALPWLALSLAAVIMYLPLPAYQAGKASAEKALKQYRQDAKNSSRVCAKLTTSTGAIGVCPYVVARNKDWIAYLDGDQTHIIPVKDLSVSAPLTR